MFNNASTRRQKPERNDEECQGQRRRLSRWTTMSVMAFYKTPNVCSIPIGIKRKFPTSIQSKRPYRWAPNWISNQWLQIEGRNLESKLYQKDFFVYLENRKPSIACQILYQTLYQRLSTQNYRLETRNVSRDVLFKSQIIGDHARCSRLLWRQANNPALRMMARILQAL